MDILENLNALRKYLFKTINHTYTEAEYTIFPLGIVGLFGFPLNYFIWSYIFPQPYENFTLSLIATILCLGLVFKQYWPKKLSAYFSIFWMLTIFYIMPLFFSIMLLKNNGGIIWIMGALYATFLLILILDWLSILVISLAGSFFGALFYILTTPTPMMPTNLLPYLFGYVFTLATGSLLNYKVALIQQKKLEGMATVCINIAHELRTPLLGIKSGAVGLKKYLPILFEGFKLAKQHDLPVPHIRTLHFKNLIPALDRMESETNYANTIIDMLLMNASKDKIDPAEFKLYSIAECVNGALKRYPFNSYEERQKIIWEPINDFNFYGSSLLMTHVLFNLLKNALHFIVKADDYATISIWLDNRNEKYNHLHFKDTGTGIAQEIIPHLFDRFFTTTLTGTGIGLSFCKLVLESFHGKIECKSELGAYTEFILYFPKVFNEETLLD